MLLGMILKICKFKKFCRADERKHLLFDYCFFNLFPPTKFLKNWKKIHRPEAEILAHEVGKKSHGWLDPTLCMHKVVHTCSIEFPRMQNNRPSIQTYLKKEIFFCSVVLQVKHQNQLGRVLLFAFASTCYKIYLTNRFHVAVRLFSNRSQMMSKCGKNKKVAHEG